MTSCQRTNVSDPIEINAEYHNSYVTLSADVFPNTFETGQPIILSVLYDLNKVYIFPNNFNIRIFERTKNGWNEIIEVPTIREPQGDVIFSPEINIPFPYVISVLPKLPDKNSNYFLRIYIFGEMQNAEKTINVSASIDVKLKPINN